MASKAIELQAAVRNEFGKGAARRARRAGQIPAVIYAKDLEAPIHILVDRLEFTAILRKNGANAIVNVDIEGQKQLTMIKAVDQHPLTMNIDHADLLAISRGETVEVEVPIVYTGEPAPGTLAYQDANTILLQADVLSIPEEISVDVEGLEFGAQILAKDISLPGNCELAGDEEQLIINIVYPETDEEVEEETEEGEAEAEVEATEEGETASE